jgi:hypothetical protein
VDDVLVVVELEVVDDVLVVEDVDVVDDVLVVVELEVVDDVLVVEDVDVVDDVLVVVELDVVVVVVEASVVDVVLHDNGLQASAQLTMTPQASMGGNGSSHLSANTGLQRTTPFLLVFLQSTYPGRPQRELVSARLISF